MGTHIIVAVSVLFSVALAEYYEDELYLNFKPAEKRAWPVTRAVRMQFTKRSEGGREFRNFARCQIYDSINDIGRMAYKMPRHAMKRISDEEMKSFEGRCERVGEIERTILGTKWCGSGNESESEADVGYFNNLDNCCREHDHCDNIAAGKTKYGLKNEGMFTMMNCKCEEKFSECLDDIISKTDDWVTHASTWAAIKSIKGTYFYAYGNGCYNIKCDNGRSMRRAACANPTAEYTGASGVAALLNLF
uniref:Putative Phospholipase A2 n=1 Tax=Megacormus gertschi TaxID=1843536 RepID=A0A224X8B1_9SCOR